MKKIYTIFLLLIIGLTATLSACGDPYKNMKLEIVSGTTVEIELTENTEVETPEGQLDPNTALVEAKITGVSKDISKAVDFVSGDESKLQVIDTQTDGDTTTALLRAFRPGVVNLEAISREGGKKQMITVFIYRKVSAIEFDSSYSPAVIANGEPVKIDETKVLFTPSDANVRTLEYSLVGDPQGASIDSNGYLTVTNANLSTVRVLVKPTLREDDEVETYIDVQVLPTVNTDSLTINSIFDGTTQNLEDELKWLINKPTSSTHEVSFNYDVSTQIFDMLRIRAVIDGAGTSSAKITQKSITNNSVVLSCIDTGTTSVKFEIYYAGHEDIVVYSKTVNYEIVSAVDSITSNAVDNKITVFNATSTSSFKGTELTINLNPQNASNRKFTITAPENFYEHLVIVNATGGNPFDKDGYVNSGTKLYITHDGEVANMTFTLTIEPAGDYICDVLDIEVTCLTSVESIVTNTDSIMLGYSEALQMGTEKEIEYTVLPAGALKETVEVVSRDENVAKVYYDEDLGIHKVVSTGVGTTTISFIVNGRAIKNINCECVPPYSTFLVSIDSPSVNSNVSGRTMINVYDESGLAIIGQTLESGVIKVGANIKVNVSSYPTNSKLESINYTIEAVDGGGNANYAQIDKNGILNARSEIQQFKVIIEATGYTYDINGTGDIITVTNTKEVLFTAIMPIKSISMNTSFVEIYDVNTVSIDDIAEAQTRLYVNINPVDATINSQDIIWTVSNSEFSDLLEVQPDGSVIITGRLTSGDERTFTVRAELKEYEKSYSVECKIKVVKAKTVESILLKDYDEARGIYLKSSDVTGGQSGDSYLIQAQPLPADAKNSNFKYFAFDIAPNEDGEGVDGWYWDEDLYVRIDNSSRIQVSDNGLITTKSGATGGYSIVWVVPADNIRSNPVDYNQIKIKRVLLVYVADGTVENPYEIKNYTDFVNIAQAPDKSYRLVQTIDFSGITNYTPIGTVENPFTGTITGKYTLSTGQTIINGITNFKFNKDISTSANQGLFGIVGKNGQISDLNITVVSNTINVNISDGQSYNFGYVAGVNNGTITNVTVRFNGSLIVNNLGLGEIKIGGLVGDNMGVISNSRSITYNQYGISVEQNNNTIYVGGLAGVNNGNISGQFRYVGDTLGGSGGDFEFNIDYNDETLNSSITLIANSTNAWLGGITAVNNSTLSGVYSSATVKNIANVGGIVAVNKSTISSVRFTGFVQGNQRVGGIAGENAQNASIEFGIVEICDDKVHFTNLYDVNFENATDNYIINFGGVVGLNNGEISYSYINSYSAQRIQNNENIDISIIATNIVSFGAFVGSNTNVINKCFSNVQLDNDKVFYGENTGSITLSYTLSYQGQYTSTSQQFFGGEGSDENNFVTINTMNFGLPMILIDKNVYDNKGDVLLTESPKSIEVTVYGQENVSNYGKLGDTNRYYKVSSTQLLLLLNNSQVSQELNNNTYDLSQMFDIVVTPASQRNKTILVTITQGQDVLTVEGSTITVLKEGYAVLRFASDLDNAIYDEIEVYVSKGITNINVNNIEEREENDQTYRELKLQLNSSFNFDITNTNSLTTGDTKTNYEALSSGGYLFTFDQAGFADFDIAQMQSDKEYFVKFADSQILTALKAGVTDVRINPYISAMYYVNGQLVETKFVLEDVKYDFSLYVYRGLSEVNLQSSKEEIMPNTTLNYQVTLKTDLEDSVLDSLTIYQGNITGEENQPYENFDLKNSTINAGEMSNFHKEISSTSKFEINILDIVFDEENEEKTITFEIIPSKAVEGDTAILENIEYTLVFNATLGSGEKVSKQFKLVLKPQTLTNILANHYTDGQDFDPNLTGAGEEVSTRIIPGQYGLLVINLWPEYSVFDRLEITSSVASNDVITFEQVYYNVDANNYDTKVENTQLIENGISLKRQSTKKFDSDLGTYVYGFDGRIFIRTITGTQVQTGQVFTITIKAYNENESNAYITYTMQLTALQAPYLTFDFTNGRQYKGVSHEYYAAENTNYNFTMVTDSAVNESSGITTSIKDAFGNVVADAKLVKSGSAVISGSRQTINYVISANANFVKGEEYYVEMIVTRNISGVVTKSRIVNTLHIVDFLVTGISIVDGDILDPNDPNYILVSNGLLSRPLSTTGWQISISLQTISSEDNLRNRVTSVERQLNGKDKVMGSYYNPWKYKVLTGVNAGQFDTITSETVSNNFVLSNAQDGTGYRLIGKSIANVDTLMADFSYYYDENGNFTLTNDPTMSIDGNPTMEFRLDFSLSSSQDHPLPVTTKDEFLNMEEGIDYILLNDIDLGTNYEPLDTAISSLDGNGYTITIGSFQLPIEQSDSVYIGLFSIVNSETLLKNVTVKFNGFQSLNLVNYKNVYFGGIAGENRGTITNANVDYIDSLTNTANLFTIELQSSSEEGQTTSAIGGLVGQNTGIITNSQVNNLNLISSGTIGGFVGSNNNIISSSYSYATNIQSSSGDTGGFVAINNGEINTSYVRGIYSNVESNLRAGTTSLITVGKVGGFVYQNYGSISDCYSNIKITSQSRSAGFVYENTQNAEIYNCLSLSDIIQNSIAHMPFVGTDESDRFLNQGQLENCYFYQNENDKFVAYDIDGNENPAQKMAEEDLSNTSSLSGFAFSDSSSEYSGIWVQPSASSNDYFNSETTFGADTGIAGFSKMSFKVGIPELVAPNVIARSVRKIESVETNELTGESIYNYVYVTHSNAELGEKIGYDYGTIHNQALINSASDFVYLYEKYNNNNQLTEISNISARVINHIDFSEYEENLNTSKVVLQGIIEGNGLIMNNISVVSNVDEKYTEFGLFKSIRGNDDTGLIAGIKNLTLSFIEVKSSSSNIVGSIAGTMHNANLIDIEVQGNNVAVKGANIVGGVVGLVTGNSTLYKIFTNISANSGFRNSGNNTITFTAVDGSTITIGGSEGSKADNILFVDDSLFYTVEDLANIDSSKALKSTVEYVSYAGAVAGVIETKHKENIMECYMTPNVYDITVDGSVKVIGATAGGVFGMVGLYTYASNINYIINKSSFISGDDIAGGIVGELRGKLSQSTIIHQNQDSINNLSFGATNDDINLTLFKSNTVTKASGGLVGFNLGGTILDCISYAYVRNPYSTFAGGAVGVTISGDIKAVITAGSVLGKESVGGLIGGIIATHDTGMDNFYNYDLLPLYYNNEFNIDNTLFFERGIDSDGAIINDQNSMVLSYVMAGNNWTTSDQNTLKSIANWGGLIGFFEDEKLQKTYINTTHPQDADSDVNLINFYVAGGNNTDLLNTRGNEDTSSGSDWIHIAEPITFNSLTPQNKQLYYGNYYRFVWDLTGDSKYPTIDLKAVPDTIEVSSASDLLQIIWNMSANYLVVDDIDLSGIDSWLPLGTTVDPFSGTLRAKAKGTVDASAPNTRNTYYEIRNLKIVASNLQYIGLFGVTGFNYKTKQGAVFENLVITVEEIVGKDFQNIDSEFETCIGALVGQANGATIINVVTTPASINSMIVSSSDYTGGIVGRMQNLDTDVFIDENDEKLGTIVIESSIKDSVSNLNIGILNRETSVNAGKVSHVGGVIGQLVAGTIEDTASNQTIGLAQETNDGLGNTTYSLLDINGDYSSINTDFYSQSLYVGGLIGSNSVQYIDAGGNTEQSGTQELSIKTSFSNSNIEIAKLNLYQVGEKIDTVIGGFAGVLDENIDVETSFSTGSIITQGTTNGTTPTNSVLISGFVGKINLENKDSRETILTNCYSLVTLLDKSNSATIKGLGYIGYKGDNLLNKNDDLTNNANATSVMMNSYYEHYYALVIEEDKYFGASSDELLAKFEDCKEFSIGQTGIYYPVLTDGEYVLGINDRTNYAIYGNDKGTKLNPILIDNESSLLSVAHSANNSDDYLYYLVTKDIDNISNHVVNNDGDIVSNNSPMIDEFTGFINGNGFSVSGFTVKESPKTFDKNYNEIETSLEVENVGLVRVLKDGSYISGLSLADVYIDYQSSSDVNNSTINVGALVGTMEKGAVVFASTVNGDIYVKGAQYEIVNDGTKTITSRNQTLNIGGIVGYSNGGSVINSANYARIASYDYTDYKGINGQKNPALKEIYAGGLVGKAENGASLINVFSISQFNFVESNKTFVESLYYGSIAGYAQNTTIRNWYGKVDLIQKEFEQATVVSIRVGKEVTTSGGTNTNVIEAENVQTLTTDSNFNYNYGYEYSPLLEDGVPKTITRLLNSNNQEVEYYVAGNTESLMFLLNNNYNVALNSDIYLSAYTSVQNYSGEFNGQYNAVYGLKNELFNNVNGSAEIEDDIAIIEKVAFSGTQDYSGADKFVVGTLGSKSKVSIVDTKVTNNTLSLANGRNEGSSVEYINSNDLNTKTQDSSMQNYDATIWMNIDVLDDVSGDRLRSFVEYWDETDVRGVYLSQVEGTYTVITKDDEGNDVTSTETEIRNRINDQYELAKYAKLVNDGDNFEIKVTEINADSVIDLSGKIWNSLVYLQDSLISSSEEKSPVITNMYVEGERNVGFIGSFNSYEGRLFNLEFKNAKVVPYSINETEQTEFSNFGVVAGSASNGKIESIKVSGIININAPNANYVGTIFGSVQNELINVKAEGEEEDVEKSKIVGLDFVGGVAGQATLLATTLKYIDNNYNISGRDFVGGYFGYAEGSQAPSINGYERIVDEVVSDVYHKNTGSIKGRNFVGGLVGYNNSVSLNSVRNEGNVSASGYAVGGLCGYTNYQITSSVNGVNYLDGGNTESNVITYNSNITSSTKEANSSASGLTEAFNEMALAIEGIGLSSTTVQAGYFYGGLVGYLDKADIRCSVPEIQSTQGQRKNTNYAQVEGVSFVGGVVGLNNAGNLYGDNVYLEVVDGAVGIENYNSITGISFVGGIAGLNYSTAEGNGIVKDAIVQIGITGYNIAGEYCVGGVVGANFGVVWSVSAQGVMGNKAYNLGGIVGYNAGDVQYANSAMSTTLRIGDLNNTASNCITCVATKTYNVGGIVGHNVGIIKNCAYTSQNNIESTIKFLLENVDLTVTSTAIYVGGICGVNDGEIENAYMDTTTNVNYEQFNNTQTLTNVNVGGLVALNNGSIKSTYSLARIKHIISDAQGGLTEEENSSSNAFAGGLVHTNNGTIEGSYARYNIYLVNNGDVTDDCYVMNTVAVEVTSEAGEGEEPTTQTINQLQVDSNYKTQFGNFLKNKFTIKSVEFTSISLPVTNGTYHKYTVQLKLISKDGSFADTEVLVNNNEISASFPSGIIDGLQWWYDTFNCNCPENSADVGCQECKNAGCCSECPCNGGSVRDPYCKVTHAKKWIELFNSDISYFKDIREQIFDNVVFVLGFTGLKTQSNGSAEQPYVPEESVQAQPSTMPSTGFLGNGSYGDPYRIYTLDDIETLNRQLRFGNTYFGQYFILMNDLDMSGTNGVTIGSLEYPFQGSLNGNGKSIIGNNLSGTENVGLFPMLLSGSSVSNIVFVDCSSTGQKNVGIVAGTNRGSISNVEIYQSNTQTSTKVSGTENVGGIAGYNTGSGRITNCSVGASVGNLTGSTNVGGIAGYNDGGSISQCETLTRRYIDNSNIQNLTAIVCGIGNVGGIIGYNAGTGSIKECSNEVQIEAMDGFGGGIVGYSTAEPYDESEYLISDVINTGAVAGNSKVLGQIAGKLSSKAYNVLSFASGKVLGEGSTSSYCVNSYTISSSDLNSDSYKAYQVNGFKREVYTSLDFNETWGMSPTQVDMSTKSYTHPKLAECDLNYNYPRLVNLNSSKVLNGEYAFFQDQFFNVNDVTSNDPTLYVETIGQFNNLINYFLGRYDINPPSENSADYETYLDLLSVVKNNQQYRFKHATYKVDVSAFNSLTNKLGMKACSGTVATYSSWTALPSLQCRSIDFGGITIKIGTMNSSYYDVDPAQTYASFISSFIGLPGNDTEDITGSDVRFSNDYLSNLNIEVGKFEGAYIVGGIVGYLFNGTVKGCSVNYTGSSSVQYLGGASASSSAGILVGVFKEPQDKPEWRPLYPYYAHGKIENCSYKHDNCETIFIETSEELTSYASVNYHIDY